MNNEHKLHHSKSSFTLTVFSVVQLPVSLITESNGSASLCHTRHRGQVLSNNLGSQNKNLVSLWPALLNSLMGFHLCRLPSSISQRKTLMEDNRMYIISSPCLLFLPQLAGSFPVLRKVALSFWIIHIPFIRQIIVNALCEYLIFSTLHL